jgi:hypothetical protein
MGGANSKTPVRQFDTIPASSAGVRAAQEVIMAAKQITKIFLGVSNAAAARRALR